MYEGTKVMEDEWDVPGPDTLDKYDDDISSFSEDVVSFTSFTEDKSEHTISRSTRSRTDKNDSRELSFPEIMEKLEQAVEDADRKGEKVQRQTTTSLDFSDLSQLMEAESFRAVKPDISQTLGVLELFETFEKEIAGQKDLITKLECEKVKLKTELQETKIYEKRMKAKHVREIKQFGDQIAALAADLATAELDRTNFKTKEAEYLEKFKILEQKLRNLPTIPHSRNRSDQNPKVGYENGQLGDEEKKRQEYLESRVAELGNIVKEYENKEKSSLAQKSETERLLKEQLASCSIQLNNFQDELAFAKAKEAELMQEKGLAEFRIRELQQEVNLSRSFSKQDAMSGKAKPKNLEELQTLKNEMAKLKVSLKNAESTSLNWQQKNAENQKSLKKSETQVRTLQRILYNKVPGDKPKTIPPSGMKSDSKGKKSVVDQSQNERQIFLEKKVVELENQLKQKQHEDERGILSAKSTQSEGNRDGNVIASQTLIGELRARLISQMQLVTCLKENLIASKNKEAELLKGNELSEFRIRELKEELTVAKTLGKPENEILAELTESVHCLHSRYSYREKELDHLIRQQSLKSFTRSHFPPSVLPLVNDPATSLFSNSQVPLGFLLGHNSSSSETNMLSSSGPRDDFGILSPQTTVQLIRGSMDEFLLLN